MSTQRWWRARPRASTVEAGSGDAEISRHATELTASRCDTGEHAFARTRASRLGEDAGDEFTPSRAKRARLLPRAARAGGPSGQLGPWHAARSSPAAGAARLTP